MLHANGRPDKGADEGVEIHCGSLCNMGDSSSLTCSETSPFPFEALFVHLVNRERAA